MGSNKRYHGYRSYSYLIPGQDYRAFELAEELDRVPPYHMRLSEEQERRVERLLAECVTVSLHDHPSVIPQDPSQFWDYEREGREVTGFQGLSGSCLDALFDNMTDGTGPITSKMGWKWTDIIYDLGMRRCDLAHQDFLFAGSDVQDVLTAHAQGKIAWFPALESATMIENELDRIDILYGLGVRMMGIVYSEANALGCGLKERRDGGLTSFGRSAVRRMNQIGMAIDLSHAGDRTALDVIELSQRPTFITHAGARALHDSARLKPDQVLRACADRGGIIGIEAAPHTTVTQRHPRHNLESFMEHFEYCVGLVGIEHVGFGPDALFGDHVALHQTFATQMSIKAAHGNLRSEHIPYVEGVENPGEAFPNIVRWLVVHGYSDEDIAKAVGGNALRVLEQAWQW